MAAVAKNPAFAKKVGIKSSVGEDFLTADKGKKFGSGGMAKSDMKEDMKMDKAQDKAMTKKAVGMHEKQLHAGKKSNLSTLKKGGKVCMAKGGGIETKGKTKGTMIKMKGC
jgi:nucleoid-associated protein YejK